MRAPASGAGGVSTATLPSGQQIKVVGAGGQTHIIKSQTGGMSGIAALAAATLFLFNAILAAAGKRRKKREQTGGEENVETVVDNVANVVWNGENLSISLLKNVV